MKNLIPFLFLLTFNGLAQSTPQELAKRWLDTIKSGSKENLVKLIHPGCKKGDISPVHLERMISGELPAKVDIKVQDLKLNKAHARYYAVEPSKQITLKYKVETMEEKKKYGLGKGFPAAEHAGKWYFVICMNLKK